MDGHIMRCRTIGSCQSVATSEIVKRCWSRLTSLTQVSGAIYSKCPDLTFTFTTSQFRSAVHLPDFSHRWRHLKALTIHCFLFSVVSLAVTRCLPCPNVSVDSYTRSSEIFNTVLSSSIFFLVFFLIFFHLASTDTLFLSV